MQATINDLIAKLTELRDANLDLESVQTQHTKTATELEMMQSSLDLAKQDLASAQSGLSAVQIKNLKQYNADIFNRNKELESLTAATRDAKARLDTLNVETESSIAKHKQIEDSINALRSKLG